MSYCKKVYCETLFLETMCKAAEEDSPIKYEEKKVWRAIYNFLNEGNYELHIEGEEIDDDFFQCKRKVSINPQRTKKIGSTLYTNLVRKLNDVSFNGQGNIQTIFGYYPLSTESDKLDNCGLYLTMLKKESVDSISQRTGCLIISPDTISSFEPLTNDNGKPISKRYEGTWKEILDSCGIAKWSKAHCNFITIVDNYILNDTSKLKINLKPILESLLPRSFASESFPLTIFSSLRTDRGTDLDFEVRWRKVTEIINELQLHYAVLLCVVKCANKTFHDRTILTDTLWISCGGGFDLFEQKGRKIKAANSTMINAVSPFLNDKIRWAFPAYADLMGEIENVKSQCPTYNKSFSGYPLFQHESIIETGRTTDV